MKMERRHRLEKADEPCGAEHARDLALDHMLAALAHLDSDPRISPLIGSQLQLAIDRLVASMPASP